MSLIMDDKTKTIVSHIPLIGLGIAWVMNLSDKDPTTSFYIRQILGLTVFGVLAGLLAITPIPYFPWIISFLTLILWMLSLANALNGEAKLLPVVGEMFQQWFKSIS